VSKTIIGTKEYSSSSSSKEEVTIHGDELTLEKITAFVFMMISGGWLVFFKRR
jgi:hypothetical protein